MKADIKTLQDTFKIGYEAYDESREELSEMLDYFHNRQYTANQYATIINNKQPVETFNVIKMFTRMLLGYYSTIVNSTKVLPKQMNDIYTAAIINDLVDYIYRDNNYNSEGDKIKLDCILGGLMCSYIEVLKIDGETDEFGRPKYEIKIHHIPALEIILDPMSKRDDYKDARFIHRYKWVSEEEVIATWGKEALEKLDAYDNHLSIEGGDYANTYNTEAMGKYKKYNNYQVVHSIIKDDEGRYWSIFWSADEILEKKEITYKQVKFPYRVQKLNESNITEFYGIFREVKGTQDAINQALIKIQQLVNTDKAFVQSSAVEDIDKFTEQFHRVNAVIEVNDLQGYKIENVSGEVLQQYAIIDKGLDRIQRILSINDSFLGMAYASDSGAKVKLQQNASVVALRYLTSKIEQFYRLLGWDIVHLVQQYFTAHDVIRIADEFEGSRWVEINKPLTTPVMQADGSYLIDPRTGQPAMRVVMEEVLDPASGEPLTNEAGSALIAPVPTEETEIAFTKADIEVTSIAYNDEDEKNQAVLDSFLNSPLGNNLLSVDPVGYFKAGSLALKGTKTLYSLELSKIVDNAAMKLQGNAQQQMAIQQNQLGQSDQGQSNQADVMNRMGGF